MMKSISDAQKKWLFIFLIVLATGTLRFYNLNWDHGNYFHPDERNIANAVIKIRFVDNPQTGEPRQMNPQFFAYGGFSIYLYRAVCEVVASRTGDTSWVTDWAKVNLVGRYMSAFFSTLTLIPLLLLARKLFDRETAMLAALLFAFCVTSIQIAHYSITESMLTFIVACLCLLSIRMVEHPSAGRYAAVMGLQGIALAAKTAAVSFFVFPFGAQAIIMFMALRQGKFGKFWDRCWLFVMSLTLCLLLFYTFSPYTVLDWTAFRASMVYENGVVKGTNPVPYTRQFDNTPAYIFWLKNLFWQLGPVALFAITGIPFLVAHAVKRRDWRWGLFLAFPILYFLYVGAWHTKFIRYMMPLVPFMLIAAAHLLLWLQRKFAVPEKINLPKLLTGATAAITVLWAMAFFNIYIQEQTRITASRWIHQNLPEGSKLRGEHWDDGLPIGVPDTPSRNFDYQQLEIYNDDNVDKLRYYGRELSNADYLVFNSRRLYGTLMYLDQSYPLTSEYYKLLFAGKLGFEQIAEFTSYPKLFGITINDDASEETFQVYDHPKVLVFQNKGKLSAVEIEKRLKEAVSAQGKTLHQ